MPSPPPSVFLPRNGGSNSMRSTVSLGHCESFKIGMVVCIDRFDGRVKLYSSSHPNDPILGIIQDILPPMKMEAEVVMSGIVAFDWLECGKTYYLQDDGTLGEKGSIPVLQGIGNKQGLFFRPSIESVQQVPTGTMMRFCGSVAPTGWLFCDGSLITSKTHPKLHSVLSESPSFLQLKIASCSKDFLIFPYNGSIQPEKVMFLSTLGWKGTVRSISCHQALMTVCVDGELPSLSRAAGNICTLTPFEPTDAFLPCVGDLDERWIVKT